MTERCRTCGSPDVVLMDGDRLTCKPCIAALGRIVADPWSHPQSVLYRMERISEDVLRLTGGGWQWVGWT